MKFPRSRRITNRGEFQKVRTKGKSIKGHFLVLGYLFDKDRVTDRLKVGYITTKRIGNAVVRNGVRRRMRGILQRTGEEILEGHYLVVIARNQAANDPSDRLEKEWKWLLHKAGLFLHNETAEVGFDGAELNPSVKP